MIIVLHRQSLFDIAIQQYGKVQATYELALANNMAITDILEAGQTLVEIKKPTYINKDIASYYASRGIQPATATEWVEEHFGIGKMIVGFNFKVK